MFHPDSFSVVYPFTNINLVCRNDSDKSWLFDIALAILDALESRVTRWGVKNIDLEVWEKKEKLVLCALRLGSSYALDA